MNILQRLAFRAAKFVSWLAVLCLGRLVPALADYAVGQPAQQVVWLAEIYPEMPGIPSSPVTSEEEEED